MCGSDSSCNSSSWFDRVFTAGSRACDVSQSPLRWLDYVPQTEMRLIQMCNFMLCPRGGPALWTPRPGIAVKVGVVPVLLEDTYVLRPFHRTYNWSAFAVRLQVPQQLNEIEPTLETMLPQREEMLMRAAPLRAALRDAKTIAAAALQETWPILRKAGLVVGIAPASRPRQLSVA